MRVPKNKPVVVVRAEVLVRGDDADCVLAEFDDLFLRSAAPQFRVRLPEVVRRPKVVPQDCLEALYLDQE
jgi:hypothetical protein